MRHAAPSVAHDDLIAAFAKSFRRILDAWRLDVFEFAALVFAAVLLFCPLFRLGTWLAEQHFKAQRRIALDTGFGRDDDDDDDVADDAVATDPTDDGDDHEAEAKLDGALEGANLRGDRV